MIRDADAFGSQLDGLQSFAAGRSVATVRARAHEEVGRLGELWEKAFGPKASARLGAHAFRRDVRCEGGRRSGRTQRKAV